MLELLALLLVLTTARLMFACHSRRREPQVLGATILVAESPEPHPW